MNVEALKKTAAQLRNLSDPREYDQGSYMANLRSEVTGEVCGTRCCIAGHALKANGVIVENMNDWDSIHTKAKNILGLDEYQAKRLFDGGAAGWPQEYWQRFHDAEVTSEQAEVAADLLDAIADGKVEI